ncbi:MAG TPA: SulP family inorganic anion transporter [Anaerolineales bacterium]|jgi:SulP family sulfate permease
MANETARARIQSIETWWKQNLILTGIGSSFFSAIFIAALEIIFVITFIALIYSGELSSQLPKALGFIILGDAILCFLTAIFSTAPSAIAIEQDAPGVMLSVVAAGIVSALSGSVQAQFATVTMMIVIASAGTGLILILLGVFNLGGLVRFLPFPIIGGFLAGTGWLLVEGGIGIMANLPRGLAWFQSNAMALWVPGAVLALVIHFVAKKINKPYTIPVIILLASLVFYAVVWGFNLPFLQLQKTGWLLDSSMSGGAFQFALSADLFAHVDWMVLLNQLPSLIPVSIISVIALLLNSSGIELLTKKDINLNHELVVSGFSNLVSSLSAGLVGFTSLSYSALNHSMSGGRRLVGIFTALLLVTTVIFGSFAILFIPKFIFGAVLIYLGLELLVEWVYDAWFTFSHGDFLVVVTILLVVALSGFLQGLFVGLVLAVVIFAISYSRVKIIKYAFSGREIHSRVTRNLQEDQVLDEHGDKIFALKLDGFIFFGTANGILSHLREKIKAELPQVTRYILLDFAKVSGVDSTGMLSFTRMLQWAGENGIKFIFTGLADSLRQRFQKEALYAAGGDISRFLVDLDHGLEWCENAIIAEYLPQSHAKSSLAMQLAAILPDENVEALIPFLKRRDFSPGEYLVREGDEPDLMYFVESGQVTAHIKATDGKYVRLETMYGGRTVGEMGFYLGKRRSASVEVDAPTVAYSLSTEDLQLMEAETPQIANIFHRMMVLLLSERVTHLTGTVRALERY